MERNRWTTRLACGLLVIATTLGVALAAGTQGSQSDPLVTLSYLNEKLVPDIMKQVETALEKKAETLKEELQEKGQAQFVTLEVEAGKTVTLGEGAQLLLRTGAAEGDGLIDLTAGEPLTGVMLANHLYIAPGEEIKVAVSEKASFLLLGTYTLD